MTLIARIDESACLAHGDCAVIAPGAFAVHDTAVVVGTAPDEVLRRAAAGCPAAAIVLIDADTGETLG